MSRRRHTHTKAEITDWSDPGGSAFDTSSDYTLTGTINVTGTLQVNGNTITSSDVSNWDSAYGWGNHASAGYVSLSASNVFTGTNTFNQDIHLASGKVITFDGVPVSITATKVQNWDSSTTLDGLTDTDITAPIGQYSILGVDATNGDWKNMTAAQLSLAKVNVAETITQKYTFNKGLDVLDGAGSATTIDVDSYYTRIARVRGIHMTWETASRSYGLVGSLYHGIFSTDKDGSYSDDLTVASYGDIVNRIDTNGNGTNYWRLHAGSTSGGSSVFYITEGGVAYGANFVDTSDRKLKKNIKPISDKYTIDDIEVVEYNLKYGKKEKQLGVIAQDYNKLYPEFKKQDGEGYLGVSYRDITMMLVKEVQDLKKKVNG